MPTADNLRNATGMSTRAGLNAQWQFPETVGKDNQDNTQAEQRKTMRSAVTRMPRAVVLYRKARVTLNTLSTSALLFMTLPEVASLEATLPRKMAE